MPTQLAIITSLAIVGMLLFVYARFVEPAWLRVRCRVIPIAGWPASATGLRILHISDLHVGRSTSRVRRFIERAAAEPADVVVITGDFVDHPKYALELANVLAPLASSAVPVIAILGNHDRFYYAHRLVRSTPHAYAPEPIIGAVRGAGIDLLIDETRVVSTRVGDITFVGLDIHTHNEEWLAKALGPTSPAGVIMLAHTPDAFGAAADAGVALLLSGHTHGGQVRVGPWFTPMTSTRIPISPPSGPSERNQTAMHVSPGLGITFLPFRFFARPEITILELVPKI